MGFSVRASPDRTGCVEAYALPKKHGVSADRLQKAIFAIEFQMKELNMNSKKLKKRMLTVLSIIFWIGTAWGGLTFLSSVSGIQSYFRNSSGNSPAALQAAVVPIMIAVQITVCVLGIVVVGNARKTLVQTTKTEMSHDAI
jgi:hypothetical protein